MGFSNNIFNSNDAGQGKSAYILGYTENITDFTSGDKFEFLNSGFGFTGTGTLSSGSFRSLSVAFDGTNSGISGSDAYFVFDQTTDTLYHDFDQTVDGYSVIATVQSGASITNAEITLNA